MRYSPCWISSALSAPPRSTTMRLLRKTTRAIRRRRATCRNSSASGFASAQNHPMAPLPPKVALVTGAARGIGLATAKRFLVEGWRVALLDIENDLLQGAMVEIANPEH